MRKINIFYIIYLVLAIVWGTNYITTKWAAALISPPQIVLLRVFFGLIPVIIYALVTRQLKIQHLKYSHHFLVMSILATSFYYLCFAHGTALLESGIAGALSGSIPIFSAIVTFLMLKEEKVTARQGIGILIGFFGVFLIAKPWVSGDGALNLYGVVYMILGSISVGASFVYAKKFLSRLEIPAAALTTYQILFSFITLAIFTDTKGIGDLQQDSIALWGVIIGLGALGTGLAYIFYYVIVKHLGAVVASTSTYFPPVVALIIGGFFADEVILFSDWIGMAIIIMGVFILQKKGDGMKQATPSSQKVSS